MNQWEVEPESIQEAQDEISLEWDRSRISLLKSKDQVQEKLKQSLQLLNLVLDTLGRTRDSLQELQLSLEDTE